MADFIIGLTGGIGSGKTAVSDRFAELGITVVDADVISRDVVKPGTPALEKIRRHFGEEILQKNGSLDRAQLRQRIFTSQAEKHWLESLLHPLIAEETLRQLANAEGRYAIYVSPLLVESQQTTFYHRLLVVDASKELQLQRTMQRDNNDAEQVSRIIASQASREQRLSCADDIIENDSDIATLKNNVDKLHQQYLQLAEQNPKHNNYSIAPGDPRLGQPQHLSLKNQMPSLRDTTAVGSHECLSTILFCPM